MKFISDALNCQHKSVCVYIVVVVASAATCVWYELKEKGWWAKRGCLLCPLMHAMKREKVSIKRENLRDYDDDECLDVFSIGLLLVGSSHVMKKHLINF